MADQAAAAYGHPDRGPAVFAVTTATLVLASVFVAGRMISRVGIVRHVSWDDYIMAVAWLIAAFLSFTIDLGSRSGLGRHDADIRPSERRTLMRCMYAFSVLYNPALMATKTSILIFYLRLSKDTQRIMRLSSWLVLAIVNIAGVTLTLMNIFQCRPIVAAWSPVDKAYCMPILTEFICSAPVNIVTDLAILALPIPVLTGMRLPQRQKTILVLTFAMGIFVSVIDVVRIYYLQGAIMYTPSGLNSSASFGDTANLGWYASYSLMWSAVEVNVGIACACVPTLKPLVVKILPAMIRGHSRGRHGSYSLGSSKPPTNATPGQDSSGSSQPRQGPDALPVTVPPGAHVEPSLHPEQVSLDAFLRGAPADGDALQQQTSRRSRLDPQRAASTPGTSSAQQANAVYFGFVNMRKPKSMLTSSPAESLKYCTVVTILFFLWGFSYGLLNTLNNAVAVVSHMSSAQTLGLTSMYFGAGYLLGPLLVGEWLLRHDEHHRHKKKNRDPDSVGGFKATFIVGLLIYGIGTAMFWPSAVLNAFGGFMVSNFVVGFGLSVLETAANPFMVLCGPSDFAEMRLSLAQGVQGVSSVLSGLLAEKVFFDKLSSSGPSDSPGVLKVQWTYLAITLSCALLALFFYYMPLPEVTDKELGKLTSTLPVDPEKRSIGGLSLRNWGLALAVLAQWAYVSAQESMSTWFGTLIAAMLPGYSSSDSKTENDVHGLALSIQDYRLVAHSAFAVSRFAAAHLAYLSAKYPRHPLIPTPRTVLFASTGSAVLFSILIAAVRPRDNPNLLFIPIVLFFLSEGPIWPLVFSIGLRGQGRRTKRAAAWLTMGASGAASWPFVIYGIVKGGGSIYTAFIVVVALVVLACAYPLFLTLARDARAMVDPCMGCRLRGRFSAPSSEINLDEIIMPKTRRRRHRTRDTTADFDDDGASGQGLVIAESGVESSCSDRPPPPHADVALERGQARPAQRGVGGSPAPWESQHLDMSILQDWEGSHDRPSKLS